MIIIDVVVLRVSNNFMAYSCIIGEFCIALEKELCHKTFQGQGEISTIRVNVRCAIDF